MTDQAAYDILVVGGSLVGSTVALALHQYGYRVALVDARDITSRTIKPRAADKLDGTPDRDSLDLRTTAVAAATATILEQLDLWSDIGKDAGAIANIQVSQQGNFGSLRLSAAEENVPALGYVIQNDTSVSRLNTLLLQHTDVSVYAPASIEQLESNDESVTLQMTHQGSTQALVGKLLIAIDGTQSMIRSLSSIHAKEADYAQQAIIASIQCQRDNRQTAFERFTVSGPLAMLPVSARINSMVYTVDNATATTLMKVSDDVFLSTVQRAFGSRLGRLLRCGRRSVFPLMLTESEQQTANRVLLLGNAARTLHPVAGQGFNLAMRDAGKFLELLGPNQSDTDPGEPNRLQEFCALRRADQRRTVTATDTLARVFRGNNRFFSHLRALGIIGLDTLPPLRKPFARNAMGFGGSLPDLPLLNMPSRRQRSD